MGSPWEIIAHGPPHVCPRAIEAAFHEIKRIESLLSRFRPDSEIARINRAVGPRVLSIDPEVCRLIAQVLCFAERTGGAFDPTAGALSRLWGLGPGGPRSSPPGADEIRAALKRVGYRHVCVDEKNSRVKVDGRGIELDLGAAGKGYAVDRAVAVLKSCGIERGWVGCGSTGYALGAPPSREGWRIGIRDPGRPDCVIQMVSLRDRAISTSAAYEQFSIFDGKRLGHICDPRTGRPAEGPAGVTVVAPAAVEADILSTAAYVLGIEAGLPFLRSRADIEACFVEGRGPGVRIRTTPGWSRAHRGRPDRRRFLAGMLAALGLLALRPLSAVGTVYLTEEEALRRIFPEGRGFRKETVTLTTEQKERVHNFLGRKIEEDAYPFYRALGGDPEATIGYGVVLEVIGKERPITFLVVVSPEARIVGLEVLAYRESQGSEIRSKRFMKQFIGKTVEAPLKLGRDIDGISGATLSSRSTAYAVKKALALTQAVYGLRAEGGA